ncbi:transposase [Alicyclobacillus acidocaldarius]|nr:transposase [Alicyclobacillus acidocaldarius]
MDIPRNANDLVAKHLTLALPGEVLSVIGVRDAPVVRALATEIPEVRMRQTMTDIMLELADGRLLHLEFQSTKEPMLYRFAAYDVALVERHRRAVRTVVLYTSEVQSAPSELDAGSFRYTVENVYLGQMDGDAALETVRRHLETGEWTPEDRVRLAFAFHMRFDRRTRDEAFDAIVETLQRVPDREEQNYLAALVFGFSARVLTDEQKAVLRRVLAMTELLKEIVEEAKDERSKEIAERMFRKGASVADVVELTDLSEQEAQEVLKRVREEA